MRSPSTSRATPISTGKLSMPICAAIRQTVDLPRPMFSVTVAVTSCPHWVTPCATTPLSAQNMTTARFAIDGRTVRWMAASCATASCNNPKLPSGIAISEKRRRAASRLSSHGGCTAAIACCKFISVTSPVRTRAQSSAQTRGLRENTDAGNPHTGFHLRGRSPTRGRSAFPRGTHPRCHPTVHSGTRARG